MSLVSTQVEVGPALDTTLSTSSCETVAAYRQNRCCFAGQPARTARSSRFESMKNLAAQAKYSNLP
jgi:hypothetical protein